jgi:molybdate transport system substrate-binding protein
MSENGLTRRNFLKGSGLALGGLLAASTGAGAAPFSGQSLEVWSCGGLAEAMMPANAAFEKATGCGIAYTGAFAAALGKSLLAHGQTEVFAPRVLDLARKLKAEGRMLSFRPLCFTEYVLAVPKGNPGRVYDMEDLKRPDVRMVLAPEASPPGGQAALVILKKAGVEEVALAQASVLGDCVQTVIPELLSGKGEATIIEKRLTCLPQFMGKLETLAIPEAFIPAPPVPFTIGVMKWAKNRDLAEAYVDSMLSDKGQVWFEKAGFIPAASLQGQRLSAKYGVHDA